MPISPYYLLSGLYLIALIAFIFLTAVLYLRANRTVIYYPQITGCLLILLSLLLKLIQWQSPPESILLGLIFFDYIVWSTALAVIFLAYYAAITRSRLPLILQMISGAAALLLALFLLTGTGATYQAYTQLDLSDRLLWHALMPLLLLLLYLPLILILMKKHVINTARLSFFQIMHMIPDTVFVFNQHGFLIDSNRVEKFMPKPLPQDDFAAWIRQNCRGDIDALIESLRQPKLRVRGEITTGDAQDQSTVWSFSCQSLRKKNGKRLGTLLVLTDLSEIRLASHQLQEKNEALSQINRQLSDYREVIENFAGASTQQEISQLIDAAVRDRLQTASDKIRQCADQAPPNRIPLIESALNECRQSLADIRNLVRRLSGSQERS